MGLRDEIAKYRDHVASRTERVDGAQRGGSGRPR